MGQSSKPDPASRLRFLKPVQLPLLIIGIVLFGVSATLYRGSILDNARVAFSVPFLLVAGVIAVAVVAVVVVKWQTRGDRTTMV